MDVDAAPKASHGWRGFLKEYAIIVIGVLTALAAEQSVVWLNWRQRAEEARDRLRAEIGHHYLVDEELLAAQPCQGRQLDRIEQHVLDSGATLVPLPVGGDRINYVYQAPLRSWTDSAWQGAISEGLISHLGKDERRLLPVHYSQMERMKVLGAQQEVAVGQFLSLGQPLPMDPQTKAAYVSLVEQERLRSQTMAVLALQMNRDIEALGYTPDAAARQAWLKASRTLQACVQLGTAPARSSK